MKDYYKKYMKFKSKYLELKRMNNSQNGGTLKVTEDKLKYSNSLKTRKIVKDSKNINLILKEIDTKGRLKCKYFEEADRDLLIDSKHNHRLEKYIFTDLRDDKEQDNPKVRYYTYLVGENKMYFGRIRDGLEFGTQHLHLVPEDDKNIYFGGEIKVNLKDEYKIDSIDFNFMSGTTRIDKLYGFKKVKDSSGKENHTKEYRDFINTQIVPIVKEGLALHSGIDKSKIKYVGDDNTLFIDSYPSLKMARDICDSEGKDDIYVGEDTNLRCTKNSLGHLDDLDTDKKLGTKYKNYPSDSNAVKFCDYWKLNTKKEISQAIALLPIFNDNNNNNNI